MTIRTNRNILAPVVLFFISSCTNYNQREAQLTNQLRNSLEAAYNSIDISTSVQMKSLEDLTLDPPTRERALKWFKIAESVIASTHQLNNMIRGIEPGLPDIVILDTIYSKTLAYKSEILEKDSDLSETFRTDFDFIRPLFSLLEKDSSGSVIPGPYITSKEQILSVLSILRNRIKVLENKIILFCRQKVPTGEGWFESYSPLLSQNNALLKPGDMLEIRAGIGYYSTKTIPEISIYNRVIPLNDSGFIIFKTRTPGTVGEYQVPVKIKFTNPITGKEEIYQKNIKYSVQKPCE